MFAKKIAILYLTRDKLKSVEVALGKSPAVLNPIEINWNQTNLKETFLQAKSQLKTERVRVLLSDDLSYTVNLKIPITTEAKNERSVVASGISPLIPEILDNDEWDYKETGKKDQMDKEIIAFAPVKDKFLEFSQAIAGAGLNVEAVEPESVAKLRNADPFIGLALKTDIKGKDENVLNLVPKKIIFRENKPLESKPKESKPEESKSDEPKPAAVVIEKKPFFANKKLLIISMAVFVVSFLIVGGVLISRNSINKTSSLSPLPTPSIIISSTPSPEPTPTPEPEIVLTDYKLQVLNGTGVKGAAGAIKNILESEGFANIITDNAGSKDFISTQVQMKKNTSEKLFAIIDGVLNSNYEVTRSSLPLADDFEFDVVITIGKAKK